MTLDAHTEPPSALDASSSPRSSDPPSSRPFLGVVHDLFHESIVSQGPGIVKGKTLTGSAVQQRFKDQVRTLRKLLKARCGLSFVEVADFWGCSESSLKNWEAGRSEPRASDWDAIRKASFERVAERVRSTGTNG